MDEVALARGRRAHAGTPRPPCERAARSGRPPSRRRPWRCRAPGRCASPGRRSLRGWRSGSSGWVSFPGPPCSLSTGKQASALPGRGPGRGPRALPCRQRFWTRGEGDGHETDGMAVGGNGRAGGRRDALAGDGAGAILRRRGWLGFGRVRWKLGRGKPRRKRRRADGHRNRGDEPAWNWNGDRNGGGGNARAGHGDGA